ncbi:MAG: hypothetical protein CMK74_22355 [Pseudomonadales bacterium]|nr:hypothetical protein [Pseudomonadales bacterium]
MSNKDLEIALRIKADLDQGKAELQAFSQELTNTGEAAESAGADLARMGESAEQQRARIRAMVEASLAQAGAHEQAAQGAAQMATALDRAGGASDKVAAAQTAAMNAYHQTERAATSTASAQDKVATSTRTAATAADQQAQELTDLLGRIDPVVRELDRLDAMERQLAQAHRAGRIDTETWSVYNSKLAENRNRLAAASDMTGRAALTTRQYQQAMRQLPMQLTDVTTSLATGMPVWMVAIQQGGQIKDSFGGIGPAARAVVSSINPMTLAIGAAAAAAIGLVVAHEQGAAEARWYREALTLTGNAAGVSSDQLAGMAERIDSVVGTQRQAAAALAEIARSGRVAGDQIEQVGMTAVAMQVAIGKSVQDTVAEYESLARDPVQGIIKLNEQYGFLTSSVMEQIRSLQDQGDEIGAVRLAMDTYSNTMQSRASEVVGDLGLIERAWGGIKSAASETWDVMLGVGREATATQQLARIEQEIQQRARNATPNPMAFRVRTSRDDYLESERDRLRAEIEENNARAKREGEERRLNNESIEAQEYIADLREQSLTRVEQREKAIAEYRANVERIRAADPNSSLIAPDQIARDIAAIEKRFQPTGRSGTSAAERLTEQNRRWVEQLEKEAATFGQGKAATREYELEQRNLTGAMRERAEAAWEALDAAERQKASDEQAKRDTQLLTQLQLDYLKATGNAVEATEAEIERKYGALRDRLLERGETDSATLVDKLIGVESAQAQLQELERQIAQIFAEQSRREQSIQAQTQTGLLGELEARRQIVEVHQETAAQIEALLPLMEELAGTIGDPAALENIERIRAELETMQVVSNELSLSLRDGLQDGFEEAILGLSKGTMELSDALDSLTLGIAESMARMASQQLAEMATSGIMSLFQQGVQAATAAAGQKAAAEVAAIQTVTLAQQAADTTRSASSVMAANTAAAGQAGAAATTATAWTPAAIAASIGSFGSAAAIGLAAVVAAMAFQAFADGGQVRGPGTTTSDSIPTLLSDQEFVTRAAVVTQPGALPFLQDFNARGMSALADWSGAVRQSTGGLAGVPAPAMPSPVMNAGQLAETGRAEGTQLQNNVDVFVGVPEQFIVNGAWSRQGREKFFGVLQEDKATIRQLLEL